VKSEGERLKKQDSGIKTHTLNHISYYRLQSNNYRLENEE